MDTDQNKSRAREDGRRPATPTGNASNPSPHKEETEPAGSQLLDKKADTYLREAANIEDVPDAEEQQEADERLKRGAGGV